jgi:hypothetical protein
MRKMPPKHRDEKEKWNGKSAKIEKRRHSRTLAEEKQSRNSRRQHTYAPPTIEKARKIEDQQFLPA